MDINWLGAWTLYLKEVRRFCKVYNQTLLAPVVTALLFLAVFHLSVGEHAKPHGDIPFLAFVSAGLIMMSVVQNAFANSSSSFTMGKVMGTIIDYLMPPLTAGEIVFAMTAAAVTRGALVGILVFCSVWVFAPVGLEHPLYAILHILLASTLLGLLGLLAGIIANTFDQMAAVTSYVISPLAFLSGTFYSVKDLPEFWYHASQFNPFFYMIDGFRYGMTGYHDGNLNTGIWVMILSTSALAIAIERMLACGYRIKS